MIITIDIITHGARLVKRFFIFFAKKKENMRRGERVIYSGEFSFIRFRGSVTPPRQAVRNIACNIFQFMLPHHTKPPTASWSKSCCRILRALTLSASKTVSAPPSRTLGTNEDFRLRENLLIALLIRRASRATFPDMGRLLLSALPSTDGERVIIFSKKTYSVRQ